MPREEGFMDNRKEGVCASGNFLTYVQTTLDTWDERPFSSVDSLVLSWLAYYRLPADCYAAATWEGAGVRDLLRLECRESMTGELWDPQASWDLLVAVCANPPLSGLARMRLSHGVRCGGGGAVCRYDLSITRWGRFCCLSRDRFDYGGLEGRFQHVLPLPCPRASNSDFIS